DPGGRHWRRLRRRRAAWGVLALPVAELDDLGTRTPVGPGGISSAQVAASVVLHQRSSCSSSALQVDLSMAAAVVLSTPPTSMSQTKLSMPVAAAIARVNCSKRDLGSKPRSGASASATHIVR